MIDRRTRMFGPTARATIGRKIAERGHWKGTRKGHRIEFQHVRGVKHYSRSIALNEAITWRVRVLGTWRGGRAGSLQDAFHEVERTVANA